MLLKRLNVYREIEDTNEKEKQKLIGEGFKIVEETKSKGKASK